MWLLTLSFTGKTPVSIHFMSIVLNPVLVPIPDTYISDGYWYQVSVQNRYWYDTRYRNWYRYLILLVLMHP